MRKIGFVNRRKAFVWRVRKSLWRVLVGGGVCFGLFGLGGWWLWKAGYFFPAVSYAIALVHSWQMPQAAVPAGDWQPNGPSRELPAAASQLFDAEHIWPIHIRFSHSGWEGLGPDYVPPPALSVFSESDGFPMRNPNAPRSGLAGMLGFAFPWSEAMLEFNGQPIAKVGVRYRGNGTFVNSLFGEKRSFKLDLNRRVKGQRLAQVRELNVNNLIEDYSCLSDTLAYEFFRTLGVAAPRTTFAWLRVSVENGWKERSLGLYVVVENIDKDFAMSRFGRKDVPIFKPVTRRLFDDLGEEWEAYESIYDLKTTATTEQQQRLIDLSHLVSHATDREFASRIGEFIDLAQFARYLGGIVLLSCYDGFLSNGQNFCLYLDPESNRFGFIPWDMDGAFGAFAFAGTATELERASVARPWIGDHRFLERLFAVPEFRDLYRGVLTQSLERDFRKDRLWERVDKLASVIRPAVTAESEFRAQRFETAVSEAWPRVAPNRRMIGPKRPSHALKRFIENRTKSVQRQLDGIEEGIVLQP